MLGEGHAWRQAPRGLPGPTPAAGGGAGGGGAAAPGAGAASPFGQGPPQPCAVEQDQHAKHLWLLKPTKARQNRLMLKF